MPVRAGQWLAYLQAGMAVTQQQYERLWVTLAGMAHQPTVILLYRELNYTTPQWDTHFAPVPTVGCTTCSQCPNRVWTR
jgi:hypothetical protein